MLKYTQKLRAGEADEASAASASTDSRHAAPARQQAAVAEVLQVVPLTIAEVKLGLSLKSGVDPAIIDIVIRG